MQEINWSDQDDFIVQANHWSDEDANDVQFLAGVWCEIEEIRKQLENLAMLTHRRGLLPVSGALLDAAHSPEQMPGLQDTIEAVQCEASDRLGV